MHDEDSRGVPSRDAIERNAERRLTENDTGEENRERKEVVATP